MLAGVFLKTSRDRLVGVLIGGFSVAVLLLAGLAIYREIDASFINQLPEFYLQLLSLPDGAGVAGLGFGAILNTIGALTLGGLAISLGSSSIAGEEANGTLGLLLANPVSRTRVLLSKAAAIMGLSLLAVLLLWGAAAITPGMLSVDMTGMMVGSLLVHLFVNTLFYGFLAMAIGAWTGSTSLASGVSAGLMVTGWLAVGIFPLISELDFLTKYFPWYYYAGSQPLANGIHWGHLALLAGASLGFVAVAYVGVGRRDLKNGGTKRGVIDRLRDNPRTARLVERFAGSARVSGIVAKTASDHQALTAIVASILFYLGLLYGVFWRLIPENVLQVFQDLPEALIAAIGGADMGTAEGWFQGEMFSLTAPIALFVLTILVGTRALAGEEQKHTMGLLVASPISRRRILIQKVIAMVGLASVIGLATFLGSWLGGLVGDAGISPSRFAATSLLLTLLGLVMGGVALVLSAATGRTNVAAYGASLIALLSYFVFSFFPLIEGLQGWSALSPFHYFLGGSPLELPIDWGHAAVLSAIFIALVAIAVPLFERRDLRG